MNVLGLISGSSLDGLDMALCHFSSNENGHVSFQLIKAETIEFNKALQSGLKNAADLTVKELLTLEVEFSEFCVRSVNKFCSDLDIKIDYLASHGHTISHHPELGFTLQIGKGAILAEMTGIPCITDFRSNDIALGGQGAPVAPIVEKLLYPGYDFYFNLGGIANLSLHLKDKILSIDSCPCNQVLNYVIKKLGENYDDKGRMARRGTCNTELIHQWMQLDYFKQDFPKSMDNSWVRNSFIPIMEEATLSEQDQLATMVEFIARQLTCDIVLLSDAVLLNNSKGLVTGGGAFNDFLIEKMRKHFETVGLTLTIPDEDTINYKEAILMSLMGYLRVNNKANVIPTVTGASRPSVGGALYFVSPD